MKTDLPKKASFKTGNKRRAVRAAAPGSPVTGIVSHEGLGLPEEAFPQGPRYGIKSYNVKSESGACIDVLLVKKVFWVKATSPGVDVCQRSVAWSSYESVAHAWEAVKVASGYV